MTQLTTHLGRTARRLTLLAAPLLVAATGTAAAHGGGSYGGGMMGGGWGLFGGTMGLWGLLWMGLLIAIPLYLVLALTRRGRDGTDEQPLSVLRERYASGELSDDEFERRREQLERAG
ncbi:SHOCT domain-containing protein [Natrinema sp. 1APR25-10V2]|uniref:SHOCT domain-containing protein n=1 Tax=Natrinema sp. 1APR25-10V2 TaxID=2951081 RepID=UPI00287478CE|nr:SHOCT domain-containing protein [Natrinema sp. 1APR25-10V2]MDS0474642.1 SHOCT domain-containing protein [Natrinema sp. 1APR25-10V2]